MESLHDMNDPIVSRFLEGIQPVRPMIQAIYVFGSRAKGTHRPDSDDDVLLVVADEFTFKEQDALYDVVLDILLDTGRLVSLKLFRAEAFRRLRDLNTPFMRHACSLRG